MHMVLKELRTHTSDMWSKIQTKYMCTLFTRAAKRVPAYARFLRNSKAHQRTPTAQTFLAIPPITKDNYLRKSLFPDLFWDGVISSPHMLTATSGSTGKPVYFARSHSVNDQSSAIHELFFTSCSLSSKKSTLVIVCFGMGVWIGGFITSEAFELMGRRGYPVAVITPGLNKQEIFKALKQLAPQYEQLIIAGYPPFVKDVLDEAEENGISIRKHKTALVFAAEAFTESFREYVAKKANVRNVLTDTMNIYGSADLGTMAFETPVSILIRRLACKQPDLFRALFGGTDKTPTLAQYIPHFTSFEALKGELLVTGDSAMPLIRYAIGDRGGVYTYDEVSSICKMHGVHLTKELARAGIATKTAKLPFVFVYERLDLSTTLYGLQIYPEIIRETLLQSGFVQRLTGRLTLVTKFDDRQNQYLEINVEQRRGAEVEKALAAKLKAEIVKNLKLKSAEFYELSLHLGERTEPRLIFWPHEDPTYFRPDTKQKWVVKA